MDGKIQPTLSQIASAQSAPAQVDVEPRYPSFYLGVWTTLRFKLPGSSSPSAERSVELNNGIEEDQFPEFADTATELMNAVRGALAGQENGGDGGW